MVAYSLRISAATLLVLAGCGKPVTDHPRLSGGTAMYDVRFRSAALGREMTYRAILPKTVAQGARLPVVYLLHGGGGGFRDWSNYSDVARFSERELILVMPEGGYSYYTNAVERPGDRYEDYIAQDLIRDAEARFPVAAGRANRAIVGVSMGGFGAVKLALRHPELFSFAGGLSPAVDVPSRPFSWKRISQSREFGAIFGPWGGPGRRENDPFALARTADPGRTPYLFLTCGEQEGLLGPNRMFAALLRRRGFRYEFHTAPGGHDWAQWNGQLAGVFRSLFEHIGAPG
jgi:S-formylglutathione hydrolase FrmB